MHASSSATLLRASVTRQAARRIAGRRTIQRFQSTTSSAPSAGANSHLAAGVAGGAVVLFGGYTWYYFSGVKKAVDASNAASSYYQQAKAKVVEKAPNNASEALNYLRDVSRSYLGVIPGARPHVDAAFDVIDELHETHGDEVDKIVSGGYDEIRGILKDKRSGADFETAMKIFDVLRRRGAELEELGKKAGKDAFGAIAEKYPQVSEKLGGSYKELRKLAKAQGPEARKLYDETSQQLQEIFSKGFSQEGLDKARELVTSKTSQIRELTKKSSQDAWDRALKEASPYLDKMPEVKQILSDNANKFVAAGAAALSGGGSGTQEIFAQIKQVAEGDGKNLNKDKVNELRTFILKKAEDAQGQAGETLERGWESLQQWIRTMPGGEEALKKVPDLKALAKVSQDHSEDAQKLAKETYEDVLKVLQEKAKKAKSLTQDVREDAKKKSS